MSRAVAYNGSGGGPPLVLEPLGNGSHPSVDLYSSALLWTSSRAGPRYTKLGAWSYVPLGSWPCGFPGRLSEAGGLEGYIGNQGCQRLVGMS